MMRFKLFPVIMLVLALSSFFTGSVFSDETEGIHKRVDELLLTNKVDEAEKLALEQYKLHPDTAEVICALACCYRHMATKRGIYVDNSAMGLKDGEPGTYIIQKEEIDKVFKDQIFIDREKYKKAEELYYEIIRKDPSYENAYFNLLNDYQLLNEFDSYFKVIELYVRNLKDSERTPVCMLDLAGKLYNKQQYAQAESLYNIIIDSYPDYYPAKSDLGVVYATKGKLKQALPLLKAVYDESPDDMINMKSYFAVLVQLEDFKHAFEVSKKMLEKEKDNRIFHFNAGLIAYLIGEDYKSIFQSYISDSESASGNKKDFFLGFMDQFLTFKEKSERERIDFLSWALHQLYTQRWYEQAIIVGNILHTIKETNRSLNIMGAIYDMKSIAEKTIYYLDKIKERRKTDSSIMPEYDMNFNYGRSYYLMGDYNRSLEFFLKNLKVRRDDCKLNYMLAKCYLDAGNKKKAREFFQINANMNDKDQMEYINYSIRELRKLDSAVNSL